MLQSETGDSAPRSRKGRKAADGRDRGSHDKLKAAKQPPIIRQPARAGASQRVCLFV